MAPYFNSLPRRMEQVIESNGGRLNYWFLRGFSSYISNSIHYFYHFYHLRILTILFFYFCWYNSTKSNSKLKISWLL
jgi:hypothetical protein